MDIHPTGTCFDDAISNLMFLMRRDGRDAVRRGEIVIVHAIIHPADEPEALAHAWIENKTSVFFTGMIEGERVMAEVDKKDYYAKARIRKLVRYTLFEAFMEERRRGHFGPWDEEIRPLCGRSVSGKLTFRPSEEQHKDN